MINFIGPDGFVSLKTPQDLIDITKKFDTASTVHMLNAFDYEHNEIQYKASTKLIAEAFDLLVQQDREECPECTLRLAATKFASRILERLKRWQA